MLIIGIFQRCHNEENSTLTNGSICQKAIDVAYENRTFFWDHIQKTSQFDINNLMGPADVEYLSYEVCSIEDSEQLGLSLKLNERFFVSNKTENPPKWNGKKIKHWHQVSRILHVLIFASKEISYFFQHFFYMDEFVVSFLNMDFEVKTPLTGKNLAGYRDAINKNANQLFTRIAESNTTNLAIIYFTDSSPIYQIEFQAFYKRLLSSYRNFKICHTLFYTNSSSLADITSRMFEYHNVHVWIVFGDMHLQTKFFIYYTQTYKRVGDGKRTFISYDFDLQADWFSLPYWNLFHFHVPLLKYVGGSSPLLGMTNNLSQSILAKYCYDSYQGHIVRMASLIAIRKAVQEFQHQSFKQFISSNLRRFSQYTTWQRYFSSIERKFVNGCTVMKSQFWKRDLEYRYEIMGCPYPSCSPGNQISFGKINVTDKSISRYGYYCQRCRKNYFKSKTMPRNNSCQKCPEMTISSKDGSNCYSPYRKDYFHFTDLISVITISICVFGFLFSSFVMIIIWKYKTTPFAKATDIQHSMVFLTLNSIHFIVLPILFIGQPTLLTCISRPVFVLVLCTCPAIIIFIKSQNILVAFNSRSRVRHSDKTKSKIIRISAAALILLIDASILLWTMIVSHPKLSVEIDHKTFKMISKCNTSMHMNVQIMLLIIQHLCSAVQAYRGRNLPGPFNEAMQIGYSTLVVSFTYLIVFPLYYLQSNSSIDRAVHMVVLSVAETMFMLIFYGPKAYALLFQQHKNTKAYVHAKMWKRTQAIVNMKTRLNTS